MDLKVEKRTKKSVTVTLEAVVEEITARLRAAGVLNGTAPFATVWDRNTKLDGGSMKIVLEWDE